MMERTALLFIRVFKLDKTWSKFVGDLVPIWQTATMIVNALVKKYVSIVLKGITVLKRLENWN